MKDNVIEIKEEFQLPGTDVVLEKGDKIEIVEKVSQEQMDKDILEYFKSIPQVGYFDDEGYTVLPSDMR